MNGRRLALALLLLAGIGGLLWVVARGDPSRPDAGFPQCVFHNLTGLHCPGCGATRAVHDLLHGQLASALRRNVLLVALLPILLPGLLLELAAWAFPGRRVPLLRPGPWFSQAMLWAVLLFWVLRNVPGPLHDWLAPH